MHTCKWKFALPKKYGHVGHQVHVYRRAQAAEYNSAIAAQLHHFVAECVARRQLPDPSVNFL